MPLVKYIKSPSLGRFGLSKFESKAPTILNSKFLVLRKKHVMVDSIFVSQIMRYPKKLFSKEVKIPVIYVGQRSLEFETRDSLPDFQKFC